METHKFDIISFAFGAIFLAITASVLGDRNFVAVGDWILPVAFLIVGAALLVSGVRTAIRKGRDPDS
ncbi:MAG: hypothetical protein QGM47_10435 [Actinomycetota bacterium]|nr:hypothetical protein [Actinomycetota bacterium]MDK1103522.1 hypothetical protein [Actinomycetota bacterium]